MSLTLAPPKLSAWALGGPALIGLCLGLQLGPMPALSLTLMLPLTALFVGALTLPGLYVGASMLEAAPAAHEVAHAAWRSMADGGVALWGVCPALLVLTSATTSADERIALATAALGLGAALTLRAFWLRFDAMGRALKAHPWALRALLATWSLLCAGLSWQVYWRALRLSGGI